ncbi:MAG: DUF2066 domain-containing protein [Alphaproteobacteria bacterium]|nr:DUF2066 domain-containing protein [Alphaproteobacteria bacterium]
MKKVFFSAVFGLLLCGLANAAPVYEADVSVDVTAKSVVEAKRTAMAQAQRDGLNEVLLSISTDESVDKINELTDKQLEHFISGVTVLMEKSSDVRYIADLRISVNEDILRAYMAENDMPLVIGEQQDVLVIPLLEKEDGTLDLWSDENIWRQAWLEKKNKKKGNLNLVTIDKNLGNIAAVKPHRVFDMAEGEYEELSDFNKVFGVYVLKYSPKEGKVYLKDFPKKGTATIDVNGLTELKAIEKVIPYFKDVKKDVAAKQDFDVYEEQIEVVYNYNKLTEWTSLKHILENHPQVRDVTVVSMANGKVHFNFKFSGVKEKLQANLEIQGYQLRKSGDYYAIY